MDQGDGPSQLPPSLGDFTLLDEIGRGGMGVVYRAQQNSLGRMVAVKVLPSFATLDPEALARFRREAEAAGRLSHPGIVPVFAFGENRGVHYFAMDLVEGPSLQDLIHSLRGHDPADLLGTLAEETAVDEVYPGLKDHSATEQEGHRYGRSCARLGVQVAKALAAAHEGKVIHRDLKPSNILLHPKGRPVLVDFGLARDELTAGLTRTGDAVGTPSYMSPEQARGDLEVDARVDVYGLGATLYELLTLRPPFDGAHPGEIMRRILDEDAPAVRDLNPRVPIDLASIVHCCLEKDADDRYATMEELERDLQAFLDGGHVQARLPARTDRLRRWLRRHRRAATVYAASLAVVLLAAVGAGLVSSGRADRLGREALDEARNHLQGQRADLMQEAYGRAQALLGEERVREARHVHLQVIFDEHYPPGRYALLQEILDSIPPDYRDAEFEDLLIKLRGRGTLELMGVVRGSQTEVRIRSAADAEWRELPEDGVLAGGEYLVRVKRPGLAPVIRRAEVTRDQNMQLEVPAVSAGRVPRGMVLAAGSRPEDVFALERTETTGAVYSDFLRNLDDRELRSEMMPAKWKDTYSPDGPDYPVRGLSFRQARTLAAHLGKHLLSEAEYQVGAYGGLRSLTYPWGMDFKPSNVAADPGLLSQPRAADSLAGGASPLGLVHTLGNVAEILSADLAGQMWLAGGHYLSPPDGSGLKQLQALGEPNLAPDYAGVRLARFLGPRETAVAVETFRRESAEALRIGSVAQVVHWRVDVDGEVRVRVELPPSREAEKEFPDTIGGFLELGGGQSTQRELLPVGGLKGYRDAYIMQLPSWNSRGQATIHVLRLPPGCAVDNAMPPPDMSFRRAGKQSLVWEIPPGGARPILVRFRRDGMLSSRWPATKPVEVMVRQFFAAMTEKDRVQLRRLLDPRFLFQPYGWTLDRLLAGGIPALGENTFSRPRIVDVTVVGSVVTAEVALDWRPLGRGGQIEVVQDWTFLVYLLRSSDGFRVLRVEPRGSLDVGVMVGDVYRHELLKAWVEAPEDVTLIHDQNAPVTMQIRCLPGAAVGLSGVDFTVLGHAAAAGGESIERIGHLLSSGDISSRPGELLTGPRVQFVKGPEGALVQGDNKEWRFWDPKGKEYSRERWTLLEVGLRHFLLRARAQGKSRREAETRFTDAQEWFQSMVQAVRIE